MMLNYTLHKDIPVPLYYQLKLQILADIKEGRLHVGDMLPPECELCKEMGISPAHGAPGHGRNWSPRAI